VLTNGMRILLFEKKWLHITRHYVMIVHTIIGYYFTIDVLLIQ
jgi:hypothetical protein